MSAVPQWKRLRTTFAEDVRHGAPLEYLSLEPQECVTWLEEEGDDVKQEHRIGWYMTEAVAGNVKLSKRHSELCKRLMLGTMTADELCEYRDLHRAALIDFCSGWAKRVLEEEEGLA